MKKVILSLVLPFSSGLVSPVPAATGQSSPAPPAAAPAAGKPSLTPEEIEAQRISALQVGKLAEAIGLVRKWHGYIKDHKISEGVENLWGYSAFDGVSRTVFAQAMEAQVDVLGKMTYSGVLEDRCTVALEGTAPGSSGEGKGVYVTLSWLTGYEKGLRRETIIAFEPEARKDAGPAPQSGMKIIGVRREELPTGKQGAAELAADLGQLAMLKLRGAPQERWSPWQREAEALAESLKITLPAFPGATGTGSTAAAGEKMASLMMTDVPPLFDKLGPGGGMHEAKALLNAFALLLLYEPEDETCARLAVLAGAEAEAAKLPPPLWKPLIRAIKEKAKAPAVYETVLRMAADISAHLGDVAAAEHVKDAPKLIINEALKNMEVVPTSRVRAEFTAKDGRKSIMEAALGPGSMHLRLEGFDGKKESRAVTEEGFAISRDEEKTWEEDTDPEGAKGLCRTLQLPLDRAQKFTEKYSFILGGVEKIDGEQLFRFESTADEAPFYWVLMSKNGPVVRRAAMKMKFGTLETTAGIVYTRLGKEVSLPKLGLLPPAKK